MRFAKDFQERYTLGRKIGSGTFGTVHLATETATGQEVAVKMITKRIMGGYLERQFVKRVQHEVDIYNHVGRSLNVAYLYGAYENTVQVQLVMELCKGGELWTRVQRGKYDEAAAAHIVREILCTLAQCHAKGIVLRDVKPENFLFLTPAPDSPLKMIDFGLATYCKPGQLLSDRAGSPLYVAPEVLKQSYGQPCDVWSAGVIAYQLLTGRFPFEDEDQGLLLSSLDVLGKKHFTNKEVFFAILYGELDFSRPPWDEISPLGREFVASLLQRDPAIRPTAAEALHHPWLQRYDPVDGGGGAATTTLSAEEGAAAAAANGGSGSGGGGGGSGGSRPLSDSLVQRLQRYGTYGRLKQLALRAVASFMATSDAERVASLGAAFRQLDPAGAGRVPYEAVVAMLTGGDWDLSPTEVSQLLATFDVDTDGNVDYDEWLAALIDWREVQESAEWQSYVNRVFDLFDARHTGSLTRESLQRVLCRASASDSDDNDDNDDGAGGRGGGGGGGDGGEELDECPFDDVVPAALREADEDADGRISREEFLRFLQTSPGDELEVYESRRRRVGGPSGAAAAAGTAGAASGTSGTAGAAGTAAGTASGTS
ncbi:hypothetical protein PLESTB_000939900 [Pleodorina starrii]|uniref:Uncharacterized protein n=1 Tax=Pleodorina starrii TaxID=330485 RepID=A0A9W6F430_9CHLO|nr:hypothetical protein PLESTM_000705300 [Pleodorina starrii]GLC55065.1 hypothetical protein PLESTB_000939900 [Pleodorina starrii]GLC71179.1 hypothetical protein PLESTF_001082900 [Pleodorina starrii]